MNAGLLTAWDRWEMAVAMTATLTQDTAGVQSSGTCSTQYTPLPGTIGTGISISVIASKGDGGAIPTTGSAYQLQIPALFINSTVTATLSLTMAAHVEIDNLRFYQASSLWFVTWDAFRWYTEGTLQLTLGSASFSSTILTPSSIPLFGIPATLNCGASTDIVPSSSPYGYINQNASATSLVTGGWRVKLPGAGGFTAFPVSPLVPALPSPPGGCGTTAAAPTPGASDTYSGSISASYSNSYTFTNEADLICSTCPDGSTASPVSKYHVTKVVALYQIQGSSVTLLPCLSMSVNRINSGDYEALIYRGGFPRVRSSATSMCCHTNDPADTTPCGASTSSILTIYTPQSQLLSTVGNAAHTIEAPLGIAVKAPCGFNGERIATTVYTTTVFQTGACGPTIPEAPPPPAPLPCSPGTPSWDFSLVSGTFPSVDLRSSNTDMMSYLDHSDNLARYLNYTVDPHWSFFYWFPPDLAVDAATTTTEWRVQGGRANPDDYWLKLRQQWLHHPALPTGEDRRTRNHLATIPGKEGPLASFVAGVGFGCSTSWWGITRFKVDTPAPPVSLAIGSASSSAWSGTNCTIAFGSDLVLTPTGGHSNLTLEFSTGSLSQVPYLLPHICDRLGLTWIATNIDLLKVYEVNQYGDQKLITSASGGPFARPTAQDRKYAGAWAQDYGVSIATDTGADLLPTGASSGTFSSVETNVATKLLGGWSAAKIRWVITVHDPTLPCTIHYPTFYPALGPSTVVQETGQVSTILWPAGPGVRFGQWRVDDTMGALLTTPVLRLPGQKGTVLDWLVWKRLLLQSAGPTSGLTAEIATLYDTVEGRSIAALAQDTSVTLIDGANQAGRAILTNGAAELPPCAMLPRKQRNAAGIETGAWCQTSWSFAQESTLVVSAQHAMHLFAPSPRVQWTAASATTLTGWYITGHRHAVDNTETASFLVGWAGHPDIATMTPWHGCLAVWCPTVPSGSVWSLRDYTTRLMVFRADDSEQMIVNCYDDNDAVPVTYVIDSSAPCSWPSFDLNNDALEGTYLVGTTPWRARSMTHGRTWTVTTIPYPAAWGKGYTALASCQHRGRLVFIGHHLHDPAHAGDGATGWYCTVGKLLADGTYSFPTAPAVNIGLTDFIDRGHLYCRDDGVLEFCYIKLSTGAEALTRCRALALDSTGTWG